MRDLLLKNKCAIAAGIILVALMCLSIPNLSNPPVEQGDRWRQPDTLSMMRNLIDDGFNIFNPQLNYLGAKPSPVQLELPIYAFISAALFVVFGESFFIARFVSLLFFALSAFYLYLLMKRYFPFSASALAMAIYCLLPISMYWGRAIIPDPSMMFFLIAGYYYFCKWYDGGRGVGGTGGIGVTGSVQGIGGGCVTGSTGGVEATGGVEVIGGAEVTGGRDVTGSKDGTGTGSLICSAVLISLGMLTKPQVGFIGLAMLVLCISRYGPGFIKEKRLWVYAAIALLPFILWFFYGYFTATQTFVADIAVKHVFRNALIGFFALDAIGMKFGRIVDMIGYTALCAAVVGVSGIKKGFPLPIFMFVLSMFIEMVTIMGAINLRYYLFPFAPAVAVMAAVAFNLGYAAAKPYFKNIGFWFKGVSIVAALILVFYTSYQYANPLFSYSQNVWMLDGARIMDTHSEKGDLFFVAYREPMLLSLSHRDGFYSEFNEFESAEAELDYYISIGVRYYYVYNGFTGRSVSQEFLDSTFPGTDYGNGHVIYDMGS